MASPIDLKPTDSIIKVRDFSGTQSAVDPHDIPDGKSLSQVNTTPVRPGELRVRLGYSVVRFDS